MSVEKNTLLRRRVRRRLLKDMLLLLGLLLLSLGAYLLRWRPYGVTLAVGDTVSAEVTAPRTMEDAYLTEIARQQARSQVETVYVMDEASVQAAKAALETPLTKIEDFLNDMAVLWQQKAERFDGQYYYNSQEWTSMLSQADLERFLQERGLAALVSPAVGYALLEQYVPQGQRTPGQAADISEYRQTFQQIIYPLLEAGLEEKDIPAVREQAVTALKSTSLPAAVKTELSETLLTQCLLSTVVADEAATEAAREQAARNTAPVLLEKGQVLLEKGRVVSQGDVAHLRALGLLHEAGTFLGRLAGYMIYLLLCWSGYGLLLLLCGQKLLLKPREIRRMAGVWALTMGVSLGLSLLEPRLMPMVLGVLLLSHETGRPVILGTAAAMALIIGPLGADGGLFSQEAWRIVPCWLAAGLAAGALKSLYPGRSVGLPAALTGSAASAFSLLGPALYAGDSFLSCASAMGFALAGGALSLLLSMGFSMLGDRLPALRRIKNKMQETEPQQSGSEE